MEKIVKLNYDRKVRYLYDKDTLECERLSDIVMDHYGEFLEPAHGWDMDSHRRFIKELRTCGLSVNEFLSKKFPQPEKTVTKPKRKPRKSVEPAAEVPEKKPTVTKKKPPVKKPTVKRKTFNAKAPVKKRTPVKKKLG